LETPVKTISSNESLLEKSPLMAMNTTDQSKKGKNTFQARFQKKSEIDSCRDNNKKPLAKKNKGTAIRDNA
jgi:hypothetical protein